VNSNFPGSNGGWQLYGQRGLVPLDLSDIPVSGPDTSRSCSPIVPFVFISLHHSSYNIQFLWWSHIIHNVIVPRWSVKPPYQGCVWLLVPDVLQSYPPLLRPIHNVHRRQEENCVIWGRPRHGIWGLRGTHRGSVTMASKRQTKRDPGSKITYSGKVWVGRNLTFIGFLNDTPSSSCN